MSTAAPQQPLENAVREIRFRNSCFAVNDTDPWFWRGVTQGTWEASTFAAINSQIDADTTFLDFGAWIGAITLYAASKARQVIAFEPDPIAAGRLRDNVALNPQLAEKIVVEERAVSPQSGAVAMGAVGQQGDSMSSVLRANSPIAWKAEGITPAAIAQRFPPDAPLLIKIDIEGGEYQLAPALGPLLSRPKVAVLMAFHPHVVARNRLRWGPLISATQRVFRMFRGFATYRVDRRPLRRAPVIESLSAGRAAYFVARHSWLFVKKPITRVG